MPRARAGDIKFAAYGSRRFGGLSGSKFNACVLRGRAAIHSTPEISSARKIKF